MRLIIRCEMNFGRIVRGGGKKPKWTQKKENVAFHTSLTINYKKSSFYILLFLLTYKNKGGETEEKSISGFSFLFLSLDSLNAWLPLHFQERKVKYKIRHGAIYTTVAYPNCRKKYLCEEKLQFSVAEEFPNVSAAWGCQCHLSQWHIFLAIKNCN